MSRFSRINTIWRKELLDTLRDRRTVIAMILVPMVLYPALMLGSLQAFELQTSRLKKETYTIGVETEQVREWLRRVIDSDFARRTSDPGTTPFPDGEDPPAPPADSLASKRRDKPPPVQAHEGATEEATRTDVWSTPPEFIVKSTGDLLGRLNRGEINAALLLDGPLPRSAGEGSVSVRILVDETDFRGRIAATGLAGILDRLGRKLIEHRLQRLNLEPTFVEPVRITQENIAPPEKVGASIIGQIVPLILVIMTITGAIYPAIDLTAGERERGTLETLMVAPVPTVDLIAGKFVVVALIGMLSAALNLLSIGGTIYLGGLGDLITSGRPLLIPLHVLPWVFVLLLPLAVMFSALLLAVCSFARSFKEAQNYVMPVMVAVMIPAIVGVLPGTRLEGPLLIMPVTNIVVLTRDLFLGNFDYAKILWVIVSTSIYAGAAVAIAAKLFGQEAVLFNDSSNIKAMFQRRFFPVTQAPSAAQALLLVAILYSLNFFLQQALHNSGAFPGVRYFFALGAVLILLFVALPLASALYMRVRVAPAFSLDFPRIGGWLAGMCFGLSTWVLALAWQSVQKVVLPLPPELVQQTEALFGDLFTLNPIALLILLAVIPAVCEEFFFRGYVLSGLRGSLGQFGAVLLTAAAFAANHHSVHRLFVTFALGVLLGLLVVRFGSLWPAMIAHLMHNGIILAIGDERLLKPMIDRFGFTGDGTPLPTPEWIAAAALLSIVGLALCLFVGHAPPRLMNSDPRPEPLATGD